MDYRIIKEEAEEEALASLVPSPPHRKTQSFNQQFDEKPPHHQIRKHSLDEVRRSSTLASATESAVYFDSSDDEFSTGGAILSGDSFFDGSSAGEDYSVVTPPPNALVGDDSVESLPEFIGAGGGAGIFKVPVRAAVHPGRPPCLELRPHPLRETQTGRFLRNVACTETQLWAGQENGVRLWKLEDAYVAGCGVGGGVERGDEDTAPFRESVATSPTLCLVADESNKVLWSGHKDGKIRAWNMDQHDDDSDPFEERISWQAHRGPVNSVVISSYGDMWSCSEGGVIKIWPWDSLEKSLLLKPEEKHMATMLVERSAIDLRSQVTVNGTCSLSSSEVKYLLADSVRAKVWAVQSLSFSIWDARSKDLLKVFNVDGQVECRVDTPHVQDQQVDDEMKMKFFSPSKKEKPQGFLQRSRNAIMGAAGAVRRVASRSAGAFLEDTRKTEAIVLAADGTIWTGSMSGQIVQWDGNGNRLRDVNHHHRPVLCFCTFGDRIYVGYASGYIQVLDPDGKLIASWVSHNEPVIKLAAGGGFVFSLASHGGVRGWYVTSPGPLDNIIRTELSRKESSYARQDNVRILIGTWNVGQGRASHDALMSWLGSVTSDVGIVVVGLQEVEMGAGFLAMSAAKETVGLEGSAVGQWWIDAIGKALDENNTFERMGSRQLAGLLISLWARKEIRTHVGDLDVAAVPCGFGRAIGNKGGVGLRIRVYDRIMCFVNCHLAAHLEASDHKPVRCKFHATIAHVDKSVRRQELGNIITSNEKIRSILEDLKFVPETSVSTNNIVLQSQDTVILTIRNHSTTSKAVFSILCGGQAIVRDDDGEESDYTPRGSFGLPRWLEVSPAGGIIKPEGSVDVKVHHEEFYTLEEYVDGIPQNWWCEDARDKEAILMVNIRGSCSTTWTSHSVKVRHCYSGRVCLLDPKPINLTKNLGGSRRHPTDTRRGKSR
ncbi:hypothetical protein BRARA_J00389 [Brassica rapa]|uniref:MSP domain-containing protein n=1 Tax=Brassica campestris TaxID=3711 RepID=A0A397XI34_BRACM|nr:hypothetical protein BRARA_J00389 [Brassica rapa]